MMRKQSYQVIKRIVDILVAIMGLIGSLPIWVFAVFGIEFSDPGPVFYKARRAGKNNRLFYMYKFRSMRVSKDANEHNFKADMDRVFPFGDLIRRLKIDELPQLINVLKGDMSLVGPRPASVDQVDRVRTGINSVVATVKPGLTGPSALYDYIYGDTIEDEKMYIQKVLQTRLNLDVAYIYLRSPRYDLRMIIYTIICILNTLTHSSSEKILQELLKSRGVTNR